MVKNHLTSNIHAKVLRPTSCYESEKKSPNKNIFDHSENFDNEWVFVIIQTNTIDSTKSKVFEYEW